MKGLCGNIALFLKLLLFILSMAILFHLRKISLSFTGLLIAGGALAQSPATETEKTAIRQVLRNYEKIIQIVADPGSPDPKKAAASREMAALPEDPNIFVWNDLDSTKAGDFTTFQAYVKELVPAYPVLTTIQAEKASIGQVQTDKVRRYQWVEVKTLKILSWKTVQAADSGGVDTLTISRNIPLSFFVRFDRSKPTEKYKLISISKLGEAPKLIPLPPLVAWWAGLDANWQELLRKTFKLDEYPADEILQNVVSAGKLSLAKQPLKDAKPLEVFTGLRSLDLSGTQISDISFLEKMPWLEELNIATTKVTDLNPLKHCKNLRYLNLSYLKLAKLDPAVGKLTKLEEFHLSNNEITDLKSLGTLTGLRKLNFGVNLVTDLTPLNTLVNLEELRFSKNKIENFTALTSMPNLVVLDMYSTNCSSLEIIRNHRKIAELVAGGNPIEDLSPITNFHFVMKLNIAITKVQTLSPIGRFAQLEELDCSNTNVSDLGPVNDLPNMRELKCHLTKIDVGNKDRFKKKHPGCQITYY